MTVISNIDIVTPNRVIRAGTIATDRGQITEIKEGTTRGNDIIDGHGLLALPGLIDTHTDALEREIHPRSNVSFPIGFALENFESRAAAAGITTVFHGVKFDDAPARNRTIAQAIVVCDAIRRHRLDPHVRCDHRVLYRVETRCPGAGDALSAELEHHSEGALVSYEDHAPGGTGSYQDLDLYRQHRANDVPNGASFDDHLDEAVAITASREQLRQDHLDLLAQHQASGRIRLLAHDLRTTDDVNEAAKNGATSAEFPITTEAADAAHEREMQVLMGAPNVVRGGSHVGALAAHELVATGRCDALVSDYLPETLLTAVFTLTRSHGISLVDAARLVTVGPARVAGLADRGALQPGLRADLILTDPSRTWPRVLPVSHRDLCVGTNPTNSHHRNQPKSLSPLHKAAPNKK